MRFSGSFFFVLVACSSSSTPAPTTPIANHAPVPADAAIDAPPPPPDPTVDAKALYEGRGACIACHTTDGTVKIAGTIKGLYGTTIDLTDGTKVVVDDAFIRESLLDPNAKIRAGFPATMPSYRGVLSDAEIDALVDYIKSFR